MSQAGLYYRRKSESRATSTPGRMPTSALREYVRAHTENRPGIYRMLGSDGQPLYVGKSVRVRTRLLSYFRAPAGEKAANLIRETKKIRWEYVPNEFSALVHEMKLKTQDLL